MKAVRLWRISTAVPLARRNWWSDSKNDQEKKPQNGGDFVLSRSSCYGRISKLCFHLLADKLITKYTFFGTCSCRQHNILWFPETVSNKLLLQCSWRDWTSNHCSVATVCQNKTHISAVLPVLLKLSSTSQSTM